jgi:hypothetical protein
MSELYVSLGMVVCFAAGYGARAVRPWEELRDWATWHIGGHGSQSAGLTLLALLALPDQWPTIYRARKFRRQVLRECIPAPRRSNRAEVTSDGS